MRTSLSSKILVWSSAWRQGFLENFQIICFVPSGRWLLLRLMIVKSLKRCQRLAWTKIAHGMHFWQAPKDLSWRYQPRKPNLKQPLLTCHVPYHGLELGPCSRCYFRVATSCNFCEKFTQKFFIETSCIHLATGWEGVEVFVTLSKVPSSLHWLW